MSASADLGRHHMIQRSGFLAGSSVFRHLLPLILTLFICWSGAVHAQLVAKSPCRYCGAMILQSELPAHEESCPQKPLSFPCPSCGKKFKSQAELDAHEPSCPAKGGYCQYCGAKMPNQAELKAHEESCPKKPSSYNCSYCGESFKYQADLDAHLPTCPKKPTAITCKYCGKEFKYQADLDSHLPTCSQKPTTFVCPKCKQEFMKEYELDEHAKSCGVATETPPVGTDTPPLPPDPGSGTTPVPSTKPQVPGVDFPFPPASLAPLDNRNPTRVYPPTLVSSLGIPQPAETSVGAAPVTSINDFISSGKGTPGKDPSAPQVFVDKVEGLRPTIPANERDVSELLDDQLPAKTGAGTPNSGNLQEQLSSSDVKKLGYWFLCDLDRRAAAQQNGQHELALQISQKWRRIARNYPGQIEEITLQIARRNGLPSFSMYVERMFESDWARTGR